MKNTSSKLVLKIVLSEWNNASRDKRELSLVRELGAEALVLAKGDKSGVVEQVESFQVYRMATRPLGKHIPNMINRIISLFTWAYQARRLSPQVISGHDIIALFIGYISTAFMPKKKRPKLVYDSHEFEIGRIGKRNRVETWFMMHLEKFLMERCAFSIMVNDSIADEVQKIHNLEKRPIVVRSTPCYWDLTTEEISKQRAQMCKELNMPQNTFLVMYHGAVVPSRGAESMLQAIVDMPDVAAVILGNGAESYIKQLKRLTEELGIVDRVLFKKAVPLDELSRFVAAVNAGVIAAPAACRSYYFGLPNKLFENIQALTPIIASDFPELRRIVKGYEIGLLVDPFQISQITEAIKKMKTDALFYQTCKKNLHTAKEELCWENEKEVLKKAYEEVLGKNCGK